MIEISTVNCTKKKRSRTKSNAVLSEIPRCTKLLSSSVDGCSLGGAYTHSHDTDVTRTYEETYSRCRYTLVVTAPVRPLHKYAQAVLLPFLTIRFVIVYHGETSTALIVGERRTRCFEADAWRRDDTEFGRLRMHLE